MGVTLNSSAVNTATYATGYKVTIPTVAIGDVLVAKGENNATPLTPGNLGAGYTDWSLSSVGYYCQSSVSATNVQVVFTGGTATLPAFASAASFSGANSVGVFGTGGASPITISGTVGTGSVVVVFGEGVSTGLSVSNSTVLGQSSTATAVGIVSYSAQGSGATASFTCSGTAGGFSAIVLNFASPYDFALSAASNPKSVYANNSATDVITVTGIQSQTTPDLINLIVSGDSNCSGVISPTSVTPSATTPFQATATLTISVVAQPTATTGTITVTGTDPTTGTNHNLTITINFIDFSLNGIALVTGPLGSIVGNGISAVGINGNTDIVSVSISVGTITPSSGALSDLFAATNVVPPTGILNVTVTAIDNVPTNPISRYFHFEVTGLGLSVPYVPKPPASGNSTMQLTPAIVYGVFVGQIIPTNCLCSDPNMYPVSVIRQTGINVSKQTFASASDVVNVTVLSVPRGMENDLSVLSASSYTPSVQADQYLEGTNVSLPTGINFSAALLFTSQFLNVGNNQENVLYVEFAISTSGTVAVVVSAPSGINVTGIPSSITAVANQTIAIPFNVANVSHSANTSPVILSITLTLSTESHAVAESIIIAGYQPGHGGTTTTLNSANALGTSLATSRERHIRLRR